LKSRGNGSEWLNFVENAKEWAENRQKNMVSDFFFYEKHLMACRPYFGFSFLLHPKFLQKSIDVVKK